MPKGWTPVKETPTGWTPVQESAPHNPPAAQAQPGFLDRMDQYLTSALAPNPSNYGSWLSTQKEVPKTLGREVLSGVKTIGSLPGALYHAAADPETPEESRQFGQGFEHKIGPTGRLIDRMIVEPTMNAIADYSSGKVTPEGALSVAPEALGAGAGTVVGGKLVESAPNAMRDATAAFKSNLADSAHGMLTKSMLKAQRQLLDARQGVAGHVGSLINDINTADVKENPAGAIPMGDVLPKLDELVEKYPGQLPQLQKLSVKLANTDPVASWKDVHNLKSEAGSAWARANIPKDEAATNEIREMLDQKLADRADEIGKTKQYQAYNKLWSTLKQYENNGVLGDLNNSQFGIDFFNKLTDAKRGPEINGLVKDLSKYGLPDDWKSDLVKTNKPLYDYAKTADKSSGGAFAGRMRAITKHPILGTLGGAAGALGGSATGIPGGTWVGGTLGATELAGLADRVAAARAIRKMGGIKTEGKFGDAADVGPRNAPHPPNPNTLSGADFGPEEPPSGARQRLGVEKQPTSDSPTSSKATQITKIKNQSVQPKSQAVEGKVERVNKIKLGKNEPSQEIKGGGVIENVFGEKTVYPTLGDWLHAHESPGGIEIKDNPDGSYDVGVHWVNASKGTNGIEWTRGVRTLQEARDVLGY